MLAFWGFMFLLMAGAVLNPDVPAAGRLACGAGALGLAAWLIYAWTAGVRVDDRQVSVRRYSGRNTTVDWDQVSRFELVSNGNTGVFVATVLKDGRRLKTQALCASSPNSRRGQALVAQLEASRPSLNL